MASRRRGEGIAYWSLLVQISLFTVAIVHWDQSLLGPIKLLVVLLHEVSHGLMALASGGTVEGIVISADETGACSTTGGNDLLIVSAGYLGSMFFGGLILSSSRSRLQTMAAYGLLSLLLFGAATTVMQDTYSRNFTMVCSAVAIVFGVFIPAFVAQFVLRFVGTFSCLYALIDIYNDTLSESARNLTVQSDAAAFAELTGLSSEGVGLAWLVLSLFYFLISLRASLNMERGGTVVREAKLSKERSLATS